jgi:DnaK suppressor protein
LRENDKERVMASSRMNKHLKKPELKFLKEKLIAEIERIQTKLAVQLIPLEVNATTGDDVDSANDELMRRTELRFSAREGMYLKKLRKSLDHVEEDDYGMCEDCGGDISFTRLKARPTSTMCITCKEESERDEFKSFNGRKSKSLGTTISL